MSSEAATPTGPVPPPPPDASFASDNTAGVAPAVMAALAEANTAAAGAYGDDPWSEELGTRFGELLGRPVEVLACWGGTGANVVGLASLLGSWQAVICAESAHLVTDECGAPARFTGALFLTDPGEDGKLTPAAVERRLEWLGDQHHPQPGVVSISQVTELGTVYTPAEIAALADAAHAAGMHLHLDGARIANALAATGTDLRTMVADTGVDVLTWGATKNGAMYGEAVVLLRPELAPPRPLRPQAGRSAPVQGPVRGRPDAGVARRRPVARARGARKRHGPPPRRPRPRRAGCAPGTRARGQRGVRAPAPRRHSAAARVVVLLGLGRGRGVGTAFALSGSRGGLSVTLRQREGKAS